MKVALVIKAGSAKQIGRKLIAMGQILSVAHPRRLAQPFVEAILDDNGDEIGELTFEPTKGETR
jgi:hypothetical protein